jgi:hypothetical protein
VRERARGGREELGSVLFIERGVERASGGGENCRPWPLTAINCVVNGEEKWGREKKRRCRFPVWDTDGRGRRVRARCGVARGRKGRHHGDLTDGSRRSVGEREEGLGCAADGP